MQIDILNGGYVKLINHMGNDLSPIEDARLSTNTELNPSRDDKLREFLWEHLHTSPFQGCELQIEIKVPIFVLHQLNRHRTVSMDELEITSSNEDFRKWFSPNEQSGRYSKFQDEFFLPSKLLAQDTKNKQSSVDTLDEIAQLTGLALIKAENERSYSSYCALLKLGISKEHARMVLAPTIFTKRRIKGDIKNWGDLLALRLPSDVQPESREVATAVSTIIKSIWPKWYKVFENHTLYAKKFSRDELKELANYIERAASFGVQCGLLDKLVKKIDESLIELLKVNG